MSAKSELIKVLTNYRNAYEQVRAQIDQIRKNPDYTEEGKVNLIDPIPLSSNKHIWLHLH